MPASTFVFTVTVTLERESGKFMSRDEMQGELEETLTQADPGSVEGGPDGDSVYQVIEWEVTATA